MTRTMTEAINWELKKRRLIFRERRSDLKLVLNLNDFDQLRIDSPSLLRLDQDGPDTFLGVEVAIDTSQPDGGWRFKRKQ